MLVRINILLLVLLFAASLAVWPSLPDQVPVHFNLRGDPDRFALRSGLGWLGIPLVATVLFAFIYGIGHWSSLRPHLWNVPEKQRFLKLSPEARAPIVETMRRYLALTTLALTAFMALAQLSIYWVASGRSARLPHFFTVALLITVGGILASSFRLQGRIRRKILAASPPEPGGS